MILPASQRTTELIRQVASGMPADSIDVAGELPPNPPKITLRYERCNELLGSPVESKTVDTIMSNFGLQKNGADGWRVPSSRLDLQGEVDLIEEVTRV